LGKGRELDGLFIFFREKKLRIPLGLKVGDQSLIWKWNGHQNVWGERWSQRCRILYLREEEAKASSQTVTVYKPT